MAIKASVNVPLGSSAPEFNLPDTITGSQISFDKKNTNKPTIVMFICNHCPYVIHVMDGIIKLANDYIPKGIAFAAISSNDPVQYPADGPDKMKIFAKKYKFPFPYLFDASQQVAKDYNALCTPDFYVFNNDMLLIYHGQMDNSRPGSNDIVDGRDLRQALDSIIENKSLDMIQRASIGCSIKWK